MEFISDNLSPILQQLYSGISHLLLDNCWLFVFYSIYLRFLQRL